VHHAAFWPATEVRWCLPLFRSLDESVRRRVLRTRSPRAACRDVDAFVLAKAAIERPRVLGARWAGALRLSNTSDGGKPPCSLMPPARTNVEPKTAPEAPYNSSATRAVGAWYRPAPRAAGNRMRVTSLAHALLRWTRSNPNAHSRNWRPRRERRRSNQQFLRE
jgi:hypothetical protein